MTDAQLADALIANNRARPRPGMTGMDWRPFNALGRARWRAVLEAQARLWVAERYRSHGHEHDQEMQ